VSDQVLNLTGDRRGSRRYGLRRHVPSDPGAMVVETRGNIENVILDDDAITIEGWVTVLGTDKIDGFEVTWAGEELPIAEFETGLPSPDVQMERTGLAGAGTCRFRIRATLDAAPNSRTRTSIVTCTPRLGINEGHLLIFVMEPTIATPAKEDPLETRGNLELVAMKGRILMIRGWAAAIDAASLDGFKVTCNGEELPIDKQRLKLSSPDVQANNPDLNEAEACRFRIRVRLESDEGSLSYPTIIGCTPILGGRPGRTLTRSLRPAIPEPREEDVALVGGGSLDVSSEFLRYLIQYADLTPDSDVLDVGCGFGRMAYMLAHYLNPRGSYQGFDILDHLIEWAQRTITTRFPNFRFQKVDVYNQFYNPSGTQKSSEFRFPYEDESVDLIFLTSVFTHMMPEDVRHYLDEFQRVLRPGGYCLSTCFLLNDESKPLIQAGISEVPLKHPLEQCSVKSREVPEDAIGFEEPRMLEWIDERGFILKGKFYGRWCNRPKFMSFQDILIYQKPSVGWAVRKGRDLIRGVRLLRSRIARSA
jgi:SAM-dependent methyltransferase